MAEPKKRRITSKDWDNVAEFIKKQLQTRKSSKFRKNAERLWKEVDRQVAMQSMARTKKNPHEKKGNWRAALELGELSRASEVLSADVRRLSFPQNRAWFDPHAEIPPLVTEAGPVNDEVTQQRIDGQIRALMAQQHLDFALKERVGLSIKESLHHGSYVVEVDEMSMLGSMPNGKVKTIKAPVWVPHSMWNCYPDPSPAVMAGTLFYTGSMIITSFIKYDELIAKSGPGWLRENISKIERPGLDKDIELIAFHGDIVIQRAKKDIYLPNVKAISVEGKLVYYKANDLPYSRIIYNGYERLDVRDPYYVSPLTKMAPTQKIASTLANRYLDSVDLKNEPPIVYDGNDPDLVRQGGPIIAPNAKTPTKNMANFKEIEVGDPTFALQGLQFHMSELQKGTSVDAVRSGISSGTEQTATEVERTRQGGQIRTVDFVDKHELQGLRPFLYLQYEMNKQALKTYQFYNPEMDAPDFERLSKAELPPNVHFDVVGSRGLLEEEQRQAQTLQIIQFYEGIGRGNIFNHQVISKELLQDAGNKNPERMLNLPGNEDMTQVLQETEMQMQELQQALEELQQENQELKQGVQVKMAEAKTKQEAEKAKADNEELSIRLKADIETEANKKKIDSQMDLEFDKAENEKVLQERKMENEQELELFKVFISTTQDTETANKEEAKASEAKEAESQNLGAMLNSFEKTMQEFTQALAAPKTVVRGDDDLIQEIITEQPTLN